MRSQDAVSLVVVLVLVAGCSSGDGGEPDATPSAPTTVETTTTVAETTTTVLAADEAKIEITYTDDGTAYVGDRMIVEGTATVRFSNETASEAVVILFWYEPGSAGVAEELEYLLEGDHGVPIGDPAEGWVEVELEGSGGAAPGSHAWTVDLVPGTYFFDVGPLDFHTTGLWRAVVFEVVGR